MGGAGGVCQAGCVRRPRGGKGPDSCDSRTQNDSRGGGAGEATGRGPGVRGARQGQTREAAGPRRGWDFPERSPGKPGKRKWEADARGEWGTARDTRVLRGRASNSSYSGALSRAPRLSPRPKGPGEPGLDPCKIQLEHRFEGLRCHLHELARWLKKPRLSRVSCESPNLSVWAMNQSKKQQTS